MRRALPWLVAALGVVLVVLGVLVFAAANAAPPDFGWSAYAPLEETTTAYRSAITFAGPGTVLWTRGHVVGAGLAVLGALVLAGVGGWALGLRAGRRGSVPG
jgi:heme/copper-type cytochrome/quinol oxidase subunit 1